jgi:DNA-binding HxlR family transcriptional regulator
MENEKNCCEKDSNCSQTSCPITYSMSMIGGKWRPIILMRISQGINRFGILDRSIDGISKNMLTRELRDLEKNEILNRKIFAEIPPRVEYSLTKKGDSLMPIFNHLNDWALKYIEK